MRQREAILHGLPPDPGHLRVGSFYLTGSGRRTPVWAGAGIVLAHGEVLEANPKGARIRPAEILWENSLAMVSDAPVQNWLTGPNRSLDPFEAYQDETIKRTEISRKARYAVGVGHDWRDHAAVWAVKKGIHWDRIVWNRVVDASRLTPAQLVERIYLWCEIPIGGRMAGAVDLADLEHYAWHYEAARISRLANEA